MRGRITNGHEERCNLTRGACTCITMLSNVTHAKMPIWYRPEMKRTHKVYYPPKKGLLPRQRGWNYCLPAVYNVLNGDCNKPAKVYTLENSRPIVRKTFQITIVMYIHGYKQISLEIVFCFVPVLEIEPRAIHTWDNGYTTELHLQPEQCPGHVRQILRYIP